MKKRCEQCGGGMYLMRADARYCSGACRVAGHREKRAKTTHLPANVTAKKRFVRAKGKIPMRVTGFHASSTNPDTWSSFEEVMASEVGDGFGVMLGDGLGCYDFDYVSDEVARSLVALIPEPIVYAERSVSGRGVHVFVEAIEGPGTTKWQGQHERYTSARFIRMTGDRFKI